MIGGGIVYRHDTRFQWLLRDLFHKKTFRSDLGSAPHLADTLSCFSYIGVSGSSESNLARFHTEISTIQNGISDAPMGWTFADTSSIRNSLERTGHLGKWLGLHLCDG
jgi:hypothetical protein